jgi:hypothetical protein
MFPIKRPHHFADANHQPRHLEYNKEIQMGCTKPLTHDDLSTLFNGLINYHMQSLALHAARLKGLGVPYKDQAETIGGMEKECLCDRCCAASASEHDSQW